MTRRRRPDSAASPGRASTSTTRPVTGAVIRTSCSSLNWTLPVVSSVVTRVLYSGLTTLTSASGRAGTGSAVDLAAAGGAPDQSPPADRTEIEATSRANRMLVLPWAANIGPELRNLRPLRLSSATTSPGRFGGHLPERALDEGQRLVR